ncbi:MAG: hypothetical protein SCH70_04190 [Candidatus Methanoperedens sp.]|nr:hypothetical protein [Candidatus Methanoperedens sp.]
MKMLNKKIADEEGYQFNPVKEGLDDILQGLWDNGTGTAIFHALPLSKRLAGR